MGSTACLVSANALYVQLLLEFPAAWQPSVNQQDPISGHAKVHPRPVPTWLNFLGFSKCGIHSRVSHVGFEGEVGSRYCVSRVVLQSANHFN